MISSRECAPVSRSATAVTSPGSARENRVLNISDTIRLSGDGWRRTHDDRRGAFSRLPPARESGPCSPAPDRIGLPKNAARVLASTGQGTTTRERQCANDHGGSNRDDLEALVTADLLGEDRVAPGFRQGVVPALELLLGGTAPGVTHSRGLRGGLGHSGVDGRPHLPRAAWATVGGGADFERRAEPRDEHEAGGVVLGGDLAAAGAAGASGGHLTRGAVELFEGDGRFIELGHVAEATAGALCESCSAKGCEAGNQR